MLLSGRSQCAKAAYCMIQPYNVLEENCGESGKLGGGGPGGRGGAQAAHGRLFGAVTPFCVLWRWTPTVVHLARPTECAAASVNPRVNGCVAGGSSLVTGAALRGVPTAGEAEGAWGLCTLNSKAIPKTII